MTQLDFKISTGLKNIIGRELITEEHTAIFELVKNAYDANASKVTIIFENIRHDVEELENETEQKQEKLKKTPSRILIIDDGVGMSLNDIKGKWLFVGYSEKKIDDNATDYRDKITNRKRVFAGSKGIGRFSVDRLGPFLNMYTKKNDEEKINCLEMNWNDFEDNQKELFHSVHVNYFTESNLPDKIPHPNRFQHGTILEITELRDQWDRKRLVKLKRYLQRLVNPTQIPGNAKFDIEIIAEEFKEEDKEDKIKNKNEDINGLIKNVVFEKLNIKTTLIKCEVTKKKISTEVLDKGEFVFKIDEENETELHDISIQVFYLNRHAKKQFTDIMGLQPVKFGSVFLYRNGFRVHPYGEEKDDWLGLETRKTQGYARHLSRREVIGRIEINGIQPGFKEVSSRSGGIVKTKEYELLMDLFAKKVMQRLERYVIEGIDWDRPEKDRRKSVEEMKRDSIKLISSIVGQVKDPQKNISFNPDLISIFKQREIENLPEVITTVENMLEFFGNESEKKSIKNQIKYLRTIAQNLTEGMKSNQDALEMKNREILFLKKTFSPESKIIEDYHHTIGIATGYINSYVKQINEKIRSGENIEEILSLVDLISKQNQKVKSLVSLVSKAKLNLKTKRVKKDVIEYIKQYLEDILRESLKRIRYSFQNDHLEFVTSFAPLEISMILDNFVTNSDKAHASLIKIRFEKVGSKLRILFADNGKGVRSGIENELFSRGFTTTSGSGIGLHHIKTTVEEMGGEVRFLGNNIEGLGSGACFEVILK